MQLRSLEVFVIIVEKNSFTKAAEALYVGQPALSKTIQKLEHELSVTLFDRSSKKIKLTDEGKLLYKMSKEILEKVQSIPESIGDLSDNIAGEVKVGIPQIIGSVFFPKVAYSFLHKYPNVSLSTKEAGGIIIENLVSQGELDIGFVVLPTVNSLDSEQIFQDKFVVCVSSKHPLAKEKEVRLSDLKNEKFIFFDKSFALYNLIKNHCIDSGFSPEISFQSTEWDLVLGLVSAQLGITVIPNELTNKLSDVDIVTLSIKEPEINWNIGIITRKNAYQSNALRAFIHTVRETYQT
ncbi:LysR family transcriptional regulator [Sporosarcina sp. ACRSM]|uniref:LysR family transcriptional regulator n=1 Tax=Sporosarcina sp. ACRSM TaxID=2918216 RepID=UPI001EF745D3|nr:LysR family transcriptional regulator [Sporosarcina sp. ACRSM]MCG7337436.1 LysR family transcriptional regulator [Sporosarcina sp. ACRSM]